MRPNAREDERGFTLIEVIMVIVLLGIIGTGILMYFVSLASSGDQTLTPRAAILAEEQIEQIIADRKANGFSSVVSAASAPLAAPMDRFSRSVEVFCVNEADLNTSIGTAADCNNSDIEAKRVRVVVTWGGGAAEAITVITDH